MERPYIICHILSSLNGKIAGPFTATDAKTGASKKFVELRGSMGPDALLYGTTTVKEFTDYRTPTPEPEIPDLPEGDYIAEHALDMYMVSIDTAGEIAWEDGTFRSPGRPEAHIIEVLTEQTPPAYRAYLRKRGVSYILAGKDALDCKAAAQKLYRLFGIKKVLICGGGVVNWSFMQQGVMDELSIVLAPTADGETDTPSVFSRMPGLPESGPVEFRLKQISQLTDDVIHLTYLVKK